MDTGLTPASAGATQPWSGGQPAPSRREQRRSRALIAAIIVIAVLTVALGLAFGTGDDRLPIGGGASAGELRILTGEPSSIDPARHGDAGSAAIVGQLFETLTAFDADLALRPALAESWAIEDGGRRVVFTLRPDLAFSDGTPLGAEDVVRSWRRLVTPGNPSPLASLMADVQGVRAILGGRSDDPASIGVRADGDRRVIVDMERPSADFPSIVASAPFAVVPPSAGDGEIRPGTPFVGSGGYVIEDIDSSELTLRANARYWAGPPSVAVIHALFDIGGQSPVDVFGAGELDYTPISEIDARWIAFDETLGPSLRQVPSLVVTYIGFDAGEPPFDDARVRQAFAMAVDWRRLAAFDEPGSSTPATSIIPLGIPGRPEGDVLPPFDPAGARALLAEAGVTPADLGPIEFTANGTGHDEAIVAELEANLDVTVSYAAMEFGAYAARLATDPPAIWNLSWVADYPSPNDFLGVLLETGSTANYGRWSNADFDAVIERALAAGDPDAAMEAYADALEIVRDEAPLVPISYGTGWALARDGLLGATDNGMGGIRFAGLELETP